MIPALAAILTLAGPPSITADGAAVVDLSSGEVLFQSHGDKVHAIASISKLMAMRVVIKRGLNPDGETTIARSDYTHTKGGSRSRLIRDRSYKNSDLLHAALMGSDNRAVVALGRSVGLPFSEFVGAMNAEAKALGLTRTHFKDPTGIDHGNVSTPNEVAVLLRASLAIQEIGRITRKVSFTTAAKERWGSPLIYRNTNLLAHGGVRKVLAGKTGFNSKAGWCVVSAIELPNGRRVALIVLGSAGKYMRFRDARRLEKWAKTLPWTPPLPVQN